MMLALRMGRTLSELRREMSASEIMMWAEFDRFSPLGDERADIRAAQIVSAVYGAQGVICRTGKRAFNSVSVSQHNRFGGFFSSGE